MQISNNNRRNEVATVLRSCLISRQGNVTIDMLNKDYEEFEGEPIPFKEFGCPSLSVFLNQLHDTVRVEKTSGGVFVHPIESEKSRHISSLVEGQRSNHPNRKKSRRPCFGFPGGVTKASINSSLMIELIKRVKQNQKGISFDWAIDFLNQFSRPVEITRPELERQLREITHEIIIHGNILYPANTIPISSQHSFKNNYSRVNSYNQSAMRNHSQRSNYSRPRNMTEGHVSSHHVMNSMQKSEEKNRLPPKKDEKIRKNVEGIQFSPAGFTSSSKTENRQKTLPQSEKEFHPDYRKSSMQFRAPGQENQIPPVDFEKLRENPSRLGQDSELDFSRKKESLRNKMLNSKSLEKGFSSESQNSYDDSVQNVSGGEEYKYENLLGEEYEEDLSRLVKLSTKIRLTRLIHQYPDGIWCTALPQTYLEEYKTPLNYSELGFVSILDFVSHLPKIFHCVKPKNAEDFKLYNAAKPPPNLRNGKQFTNQTLNSFQQIDDQPEAFPDKLDVSTSRMLLPEGVLGIGETVGPISVVELGGNEGYEEVLVSKVISPSFFWIQIRRKFTKFREFMAELKSFYEKNQSKYKIPLILIEKGFNVVCFSDEKWRRGIVKEVLPGKHATIHFYDCGTEKILTPDNIYFLHRSFSHLPAQAIPCGLFNVKPYQTSKWSKAVTWEFISKTSIPLVATIGHIDVQENSMLVTLTDTRGEKDLHINDWMYDEKFGEQGQVFFKNCNFAFLHYKECMEHKGYDPSSIHKISSERLKSNEHGECFESISVESNSEDQGKETQYQDAKIMEETKSSLTKSLPVCETTQILKESKSRIEMYKKFLIKQMLNTENCSESVSKLDSENQVKKPDNGLASDSIPKLSPLPMKEEPTKKKRGESYFGEIGCECGGNGRMEPIDWTELRLALNEKDNLNVSSAKPCILNVDNSDMNSTYCERNMINPSLIKPQVLGIMKDELQDSTDKVIEQQQEVDHSKTNELPPKIRRLLELQSKMKAANLN